jgi:hypothetical protein
MRSDLAIKSYPANKPDQMMGGVPGKPENNDKATMKQYYRMN